MSKQDDKRSEDPRAPKSMPAAEELQAGSEAALLQELQQELQNLRAERDQLEEQVRRALADAANMRRRQQQETEDSRRRIVEGFTQELLPVLDNFQLALKAFAERSQQTDPSSLLEGVRMVQSLLTGALERHGLQEIQAEGQPFDPARHEAVAVEPRTDVEPGLVLQVLQTGYLLGERVLRHAKVLVAGEPSSDERS